MTPEQKQGFQMAIQFAQQHAHKVNRKGNYAPLLVNDPAIFDLIDKMVLHLQGQKVCESLHRRQRDHVLTNGDGQ